VSDTSARRTAVIVGCGITGVTAALELRARGWRVTLVDPGPVPRPSASSTDISKVVRMDYGADALYTEMCDGAIDGWHQWNARWGSPLYHQDGFVLLSREPMRPGGYEYDSYALIRSRGHRLERLDRNAIAARFPAWSAGYVDGYFNQRAGWAESGKVVARLADEARTAGVVIESAAFARLIDNGSHVVGIRTSDGGDLRADVVLVAAGAWTPVLLPHLDRVMWATGQPVVHLSAAPAAAWQAPRFPVWGADLSNTGWYGFPALADGTLKIGHHAAGRRVHPDEPRTIDAAHLDRVREFLAESLPGLADAPIVATRLCLYCDTFDGNFWIDHDPDQPGLVVAAGDSGHGFKFAPVFGPLIADVVERRPNPWAARFRWRARDIDGKEAARAL
jgi:sarcosine oxidase